MPETVIGQKIIAEIRRIAAEQPDFVYETPAQAGVCMYVSGGEGSCIVGRALVNLDLLSTAVEHDYAMVVPHPVGHRRHRVNTSRASEVIPFLGLEVSEGELAWITRVQRLQDRRTPWGEAIEIADAHE